VVFPLGSSFTNCLFLFLSLAFSLCTVTQPGTLTIGDPITCVTGTVIGVDSGGVTNHTLSTGIPLRSIFLTLLVFVLIGCTKLIPVPLTSTYGITPPPVMMFGMV